MKVYAQIAQLIEARVNCKKSGNDEWFGKHGESIIELVKNFPSGSGFDSGTTIDFDRSTPNRLIFLTSYHHMNNGGMYDGWTEHEIRIKPDLASGFEMVISGRDRNDIKEYIAQMFEPLLNAEVAK